MNWNLTREERIKLMHISERLSAIKDLCSVLYMDSNLPKFYKQDLKSIYYKTTRIQEELDSIIY